MSKKRMREVSILHIYLINILFYFLEAAAEQLIINLLQTDEYSEKIKTIIKKDYILKEELNYLNSKPSENINSDLLGKKRKTTEQIWSGVEDQVNKQPSIQGINENYNSISNSNSNKLFKPFAEDTMTSNSFSNSNKCLDYKIIDSTTNNNINNILAGITTEEKEKVNNFENKILNLPKMKENTHFYLNEYTKTNFEIFALKLERLSLLEKELSHLTNNFNTIGKIIKRSVNTIYINIFSALLLTLHR